MTRPDPDTTHRRTPCPPPTVTSEDFTLSLRSPERNEQGIPPAPPDALSAAGRRLWLAVVTVWELSEVELVLLLEAARTADLLDALEARVVLDGPLITDGRGTRANPAATEVRQQRICLARLLAGLRIPQDPDGPRTQRRSGFRTPYSLGGEG